MASVAPDLMADNDDITEVIVNPNQLTAKIAQWKAAGFHVLSPAVKFTSFAPNFGVNVGALVISTDPAMGECYYDKAAMKEDERAIARVGLDKFTQLGGISWLPSSRRTDPRTVMNLWEYHVDGAYVSYDGTPQIISGTSEVDLRDGSAQIGGWTPQGWKDLLARNGTSDSQKVWHIGGWSEQRVMNARRFGLRLAETKAKNAAIRTLGLKGKYTLAELDKPFIILRFQYIPDMTDESVRHMVAQAHMRGVSSLYAGAARHELPASTGADNIIDFSTVRRPEPVPVGASSTVAVPPVASKPAEQPAEPIQPAPVQGATSTPAATAPAAPSTPAQPGILPSHFVKDVKPEPKQYGKSHAKAGQSFIKYHVIDGDGVDHVTLREALAKKAMDARDAQTPVALKSARNNFNEMELSSIEPLTGTPVAPAKATEFKL